MFYSVFFILLCLSGFSFIFSGLTVLTGLALPIKILLVVAVIPLSHFLARSLDWLIAHGASTAAEDSEQAQDDEAIRFLFIKTLFISLGRVANADNQVCDNELEFAEQVTVRLKLCADYADMAVQSFQAGIYNHTDFDKDLQAFAKASAKKRGLQQIMFEILLDMASKNGQFSRAEYLLLEKIRNSLQQSNYLDELLATAKADSWQDSAEDDEQPDNQSSKQNSKQNDNSQQTENQRPNLDKKTRLAFKLLGLKTTAEKAEIKRRYRQLMKMHHPDRLIAEGMPTDLIEQATQRAAKINKAYKHLRSALNFR